MSGSLTAASFQLDPFDGDGASDRFESTNRPSPATAQTSRAGPRGSVLPVDQAGKILPYRVRTLASVQEDGLQASRVDGRRLAQ
jgi:hypothetical protein